MRNKGLALLGLIGLICLLYLSETSQAYEFDLTGQNCNYNKSNPSLKVALDLYGSMEWNCAHHVLYNFLNRGDLNLDNKEKAQANFLLAAVNFQARLEDGEDPESFRDTVIFWAMTGFLATPNWNRGFYCSIPQYLNWIEEGRLKAIKQKQGTSINSSHLLKLAVATVAWSAVIYFAGSGDDESIEIPLPDFPETPGGKR